MPRLRWPFGPRLTGVLALVVLLLPPTPARGQAPDADFDVEIRRTAYGVPHIRGADLRAAGYGLGWVQVEDYGPQVVRTLLRNRGQLALRHGVDSLDSDFTNRPIWLRAVGAFPQLPADVRAVYEGFAAGVNRYVTLHPEAFPAGTPADFTGPDVLTTDMDGPSPARARGVIRRLQEAAAAAAGAPVQAAAAEAEDQVLSLLLPSERPDEGSNSWALAPSRTRSGHAILLRNPHLSWSAGYYEAHVTVPGVLDFYGDFRIGGPFRTIGGFNERLGFSTTNNAPDPDEVYALQADPHTPDHYLFDGASVPLRHVTTTLPYRTGDAVATETRTAWETHLGPVVHRADGTIYVLKAAGGDEYRLGEQWLAMMRAQNLPEWKEAMRMLAKPSSNFTYADADGNIFYVWYGQQPRLPHVSGGDTLAVAAASSADVWTRLTPFDSLPQLHNPRGGYIHQENDPFHYTNLNEVLPAESFGSNFPPPELGLRSQHALQVIAGQQRFSLEDVVQAKHSYGMLLADRVKADLLAAVAAGPREPAVDSAAALLRGWDNTVAPDSRGGVLFEAWWDAYGRAVRQAGGELWGTPWSQDAPAATPAGLGSPDLAPAALAAALDDTRQRYGRWDVAWGDVHRVRIAGVDLPVGGCTGALGCFRVLWYERDEDGLLRVRGGDGWVLAVEFSSPPRAYSVLAYGVSAREDSPYHGDQAEMFARGVMKRVAFTEEEIAASTVRRYRPGAGNR